MPQTSVAAEAAADAMHIAGLPRTGLLGACTVLAAVGVLALVSYSLGLEPVSSSIVACAGAIVAIAVIWFLVRQQRRRMAAYFLIVLYVLLAADMVWSWGIDTPIGLLVFSVVVVLSGILLVARHAMWAAIMAGLILIAVQMAFVLDWRMPSMAGAGGGSYYVDAAVYGVIFCMLALMLWIHNYEMEGPLGRAKKAEAELLLQQATLRRTVERRTAQLRLVQLEEMQQMYRFAELGQLGVTLLHDLANHLTALTLEIEGMQSKRNTKALIRAQEITGYLEAVVDNTRTRLHGDTQIQTFDLVRITDEVVAFLGYKAEKARVKIDWQPPANAFPYVGDPICFSQVVAIIVGNAIDAYSGQAVQKSGKGMHRRLEVAIQCDKMGIKISVSDWGKGISRSQRKQLFKPFHSTKKTGLGIGLFIARQTVEINFGGTIALGSRSDRTEFIITLPAQCDGSDSSASTGAGATTK